MLSNSKYSLEFCTQKLRESTGKALEGEPKIETISGKGFASRIYRLVYENGESFVAKLPTDEPTALATVTTHTGTEEELKTILQRIKDMITSVHATEVDFYHLIKTIPGFEKPEAKIAQFFYAEKVGPTSEGIILMEDLTRRGAHTVELDTSYNEEQVMSCIDTFVHWHALSLAAKDLPVIPSDKALVEAVHNHCLRSLNEIKSRNLPWLTDDMVAYLEKCVDAEHIMETRSNVERSKVGHVLTHNDYWPNNMLLTERELAAVVDWQTFSTGVFTTDLVGLFSVAMSPELRRQLMDRALRRYFDEMTAKKHTFARPFEATYEEFLDSVHRSFDWGVLQMLMTTTFNPHMDQKKEGELEGALTRRLHLLLEDIMKWQS